MSTDPAKSSRRRPNTKAPRGPPKKQAETTTPAPVAATPAPVVEKAARPPRPPRVETAPITEDFVGKTFVGRISDVILHGQPIRRPVFGFINIGDNVEAVESVPSIFFKRSEFNDADHRYPRRGYQVEFTVSKNEEGKFFAVNVHLTPAGKAEADENKKKADEAKAARKEAAAAATPAPVATTPAPVAAVKTTTKPTKTTATPKPTTTSTPTPAPVVKSEDGAAKKKSAAKKVKNDTIVQLKVTLEGKPESHTVDVKVGAPLGGLKKEIIKLFNATGDFKINHVTSENPEGTYLSMSILRSLKNGDHIHFAKAEPAATTTA